MSEKQSEMMSPENWKWVKLGEVCDFVGGGTPSKQQPSYWNGNINWASVKDIKGDYLNSTEDSITETGLKNSAANIAEINDVILITRISPGKTIIANVMTAINQDLKIVKPKFETTSKFINYYFKAFERSLIKKSSGMTVLGITLINLKEIKIPLLNIETQNQIVSKIEELFSELDNGIENLRIAQQQLKVYRQGVLKWAFEGKLTNENLKEGELPRGWKWVTIGDVVKISSQKHSPSKPETHFYIGLEHIEKHTGKLTSKVGTELITTIKNKFSKNDLLYGKLRPNLNKVHLAKEAGVCSTDILVLQTTSECLGQYLHPIMQSSNFVNLMSENTSGVNLPRVSTKFILNYNIPLPSIQEQTIIIQKIESRLSVADKMEESITQSLQQAEALRQSILKKAFEGKLI